MQEHYTPKGKHLTIDNRRLIERWKNENKSNREIAGLLGKAPQTIHNEVKKRYNFTTSEKKGYTKRSILPITHKLFTNSIENGR
ncbi:putative transposase-IS1239 [Streptococcus pneumoniae GA40410]|nr:putative transposase-IS1239 [Streptococcus pneumoniae GA40410]